VVVARAGSAGVEANLGGDGQPEAPQLHGWGEKSGWLRVGIAPAMTSGRRGAHRCGTLPERQRSSGDKFRRRIFMRCPPALVRGRDKGTGLGVSRVPLRFRSMIAWKSGAPICPWDGEVARPESILRDGSVFFLPVVQVACVDLFGRNTTDERPLSCSTILLSLRYVYPG